jgi:hypothetical protein
MTGASFGERIWWESSVPVFLEKYVLPVLATVTTALVFMNPMKFDWSSRIALFIGVLAIAYLLSHQLHLRNEAIRTGTAPTNAAAGTQPTVTQNAQDCASNVAGDKNKSSVNCEDKNK